MLGRCTDPGLGQRLGGGAHPTLPVDRAGGGVIAGDELEEAQAALPVGGMFAGIDAGEGGGGHALALHLVEKLGEAVGEVEARGTGGHARVGGREARDEAGELELAPQRRHRRGSTTGSSGSSASSVTTRIRGRSRAGRR